MGKIGFKGVTFPAACDCHAGKFAIRVTCYFPDGRQSLVALEFRDTLELAEKDLDAVTRAAGEKLFADAGVKDYKRNAPIPGDAADIAIREFVAEAKGLH